jgi:anti-anti-sigma regulatory factor
MNIVFDNNREGKVVRIDIGQRLDLTAYKPFSEVTIRAVDNPQVVAIVVDFSKTHQLFDSGKAMLYDLITKAGYLKIPVRLVNASPDISLELSLVEYSTQRLYGNGDIGASAQP